MGMLILPGTGRGTMRSMVEGRGGIGFAPPHSASTVRWRGRSPSPRAGRNF